MRKLTHNPILQMIVGVILLLSVAIDFIHVYYGLAGVGLLHVGQGIGNILQGLERIEKGKDNGH